MSLSHTIGIGFLVLAFPTTLMAQTSCGSIYGVDFFAEPFSNPIEDCAAPFGPEELNPDIRLLIDGAPLVAGESYPLAGTSVSLTYEGTVGNAVGVRAYRHDGSDYEEVFRSRFRPPYTLTFPDPGTYTLVVTDEIFVPSLLPTGDRWFSWLVPTAHAYTYVPPIALRLTITVTAPPTGASSVLFLPGIMGTRLYEESSECDSETTVQERWLSRDECDHLRLMTNLIGQSKYPLYTKSGSVIDETYGLNLYKTFIDTLTEWKDTGFIADHAIVPYDWRLSLEDILRTSENADGRIVYDVTTPYTESYLYKSFARLVETSKSGRVTIVTHSNGGLLAKFFLETLRMNNDPLVDKVDNIVMIAAPQVGTPDALVGLLHGTEINFVLKQATTRTLLNTMPFIYHLLPHARYFSGPGSSVTTPVITFEPGTSTAAWIRTYGTEIDTRDEMLAFLSKNSGRPAPEADDLLNPAVVDEALFGYKNTVETALENWEPGPNTRLYQVAGAGIDTPIQLSYFTDRECVGRNPIRLFECSAFAAKLGYRVNMVVDGDGTVVLPSGLSLSESEKVNRRWIDLKKYNNEGVLRLTNKNRVHKDIIEIEPLVEYIGDILNDSVKVSYEYLSAVPPMYPDTDRLAFTLHSPLEMTLETPGGARLSSTTETLPGGVYRRYGEIQYISLPAGETDFVLRLTGTAFGSFTLESEQINGTRLAKRNTYSAIPTTAGTSVELQYTKDSDFDSLVLKVDYDNNGAVDVTYNTSGIVQDRTTYEDLQAAINSLGLKKNLKSPLLVLAKTAAALDQKSAINPKNRRAEIAILQVIRNTLSLYAQRGLIPQEQKKLIDEITKKLE
jgi:hypothetical protein